MKRPTLRRKGVTLDELAAELHKATAETASAEAEVELRTQAFSEADALDVSVRLGEIEEAAARAVQAEAREGLDAAVEKRDRLLGVVEALRQRCVEQARADVAAQEAAARSQTQAAAVEVDQAARELEAAQERHEQARQAERVIAEAVRQRLAEFDPAVRAQLAAQARQEGEIVRWAAHGGSLEQVPPQLRPRVVAERERLERERQQSLARSHERNRREALALGVHVDSTP